MILLRVLLGLLLTTQIVFISQGQTPELVMPVGHSIRLNSAVFSSDDKLIVSSGLDQRINILDSETGLLIKTIKHDNTVYNAVFSPDKKYIIASTLNGAIVWETISGKLFKKINSGFTISSQAGSTNALLLTDSGIDIGISLWDFDTGNLITRISNSAKNNNWERSFINNIRTKGLHPTAEFNFNSKSAIGLTSKRNVGLWEVKSGKILHTLVHQSEVNSLKFSLDGALVITTDYGKDVLIWNAKTGELIKKIEAFNLKEANRAAVFNPTGIKFLTYVCIEGKSEIDLWDSNSGQRLISIPEYSGINTVNFSNDGKRIVVAAKDNSIKIYDAVSGALLNILLGSGKIHSSKFNHDKTKIGVAFGKEVLVLDVATGFLQNRFLGHTDKVTALAFSPNGEFIASGSVDKSLKLWSLSKGSIISTFNQQSSVLSVAFDKSGKSIYFGSDEVMKLNVENGAIYNDIRNNVSFRLDHGDSETIWTDTKTIFDDESLMDDRIYKYLFTPYTSLRFRPTSTANSPNGKLMSIQFAEDSLRIYNIKSGEIIKSIYPTIESYKSKYWAFYVSGADDYVIAPDSTHAFIGSFHGTNTAQFSDNNQKLLFVSIEAKSRIYDLTTKKIETIDGAIQDINWKTNLAIVLENNQLHLKDIITKKTLLTWTPIGESEYIITHPSGLFDASPGAMDKLYFVQGMDIIDFNQLKARYYEPGLWKKVMEGKPIRNVVGFKTIDLPPGIRVGQVDDKGYLQIDLTNRGGGIGEINLFINGKEVIKDARDSNVKPDSPNASIKVFVGKHKSIIKGQENFIGVKAWNKDHWVQSRGTGVTYQSKEIEQYQPAVHILTCGVSDYTGDEIDLKYAAKDAGDMSKALQIGAKKLFGVEKSYVYNLTTSESKESYPTKVNILKAFEKISSTAHPLDIFVMYVSGHGINYGGQDGDWHYLTQEAYTASAAAYNDPAIRTQTTISSNELVELFKKIPALKQVLMLDACASGKVVDNLMAQKDIESSTLRALDRMRDRTGMHIITGCTADAVSYEASKYGQGVLTYSLLEGIRGAALREDQYVDVNKLFQYAQDRVPQLAEGIGGIQSPQVFSPQGSQSFDIGLLSDIEKKEIPIAKIRPVYIRSNFQDENEMEDVLGLGKLINESLNEVSSKGIDSQIIFVDVADYPEGCKLIGRYRKENGKIILKLRRKCGGEDKTYDLKADDVEGLKTEILKIL